MGNRKSQSSPRVTSPPTPLSLKRGGATRTNATLSSRGGVGAAAVAGEVCGLILSGGLSTRMGEDKRLIDYHGKPQEEYLFELLSNCCSEIYVSVNQNQATDLPHIIDLDLSIKSPIVGIFSAFHKNPQTAWLVVACDMPFVNTETLEYLIKHRNPKKFATAFLNPEENFPEPLLTIYEPQIFEKLEEAIHQGKKSPMKLLQSLDIELLQVSDKQVLMNINTVVQRESVGLFGSSFRN